MGRVLALGGLAGWPPRSDPSIGGCLKNLPELGLTFASKRRRIGGVRLHSELRQIGMFLTHPGHPSAVSLSHAEDDVRRSYVFFCHCAFSLVLRGLRAVSRFRDESAG